MSTRRKPQLIWIIILFQATSAFGIQIKFGTDEESKFQKIEIPDYFNPFENCTIIVKIPTNTSTTQTEHLTPIILERYGLNHRKITEDKFSIQRRRNPSPHCWASFSIFPEYYGRPESEELYFYKILGLGSDFIDPIWPRQYFIFVTTIKSRIQQYMQNMGNVTVPRLGLREVIIVDTTYDLIGVFPYLTMHYYNMYYIDKPIWGMEPSQQWYRIEWLPKECLPQIELVSRNVSGRNKYFWYAIRTVDKKIYHIHELFKMVEQRTIPNLRYRYISNLTTFNGFVAFWVLEDMMKHDYSNFTPYHNIPPIIQLPTYNFLGHTFILEDIQRFSYLSCYQVRSTNSVVLSELLVPFDMTVWLCAMASLVAGIVLLTAALDNFISKGILLTIGMCLENSVLGYLSYNKPTKFQVAVRTQITILALLEGTLLSNFYKTYFTMEMIVPKIYKSPWNGVMNVEGIKIIMPFYLLNKTFNPPI